MTASTSLPTPLELLDQVFGYPAFRGPQAAIVEHMIEGGDALVLMPTGGGKSLCYQIPAIARQNAGCGVTLVISPLIALMHDQVGALHEAGVAAAFLNSTQSAQESSAIEQQLLRGELTLLYAAPERLNTARMKDLLGTLHARGKLSLFAIDEAHCVSQWGHDFRPEYRSLSLLHELFPDVPRMALTATADALTRQDMLERLNLQHARHFVSSFDRPNIRYTIVEKTDATRQLLRFISTEHAGEAGIVYCQSRKRVEEVATLLQNAGIEATAYHAGLDSAVRQQRQDRFLRDEGLVMVATIAFGMGIDKPDVRFVAHLDMPKNIEGYYQETGRAGRDGLPSNAWMAYGLNDVVNQRRMIDTSETASEAFKAVMRGKLDALLSLAEDTGCRRAALLAYFGEELGSNNDEQPSEEHVFKQGPRDRLSRTAGPAPFRSDSETQSFFVPSKPALAGSEPRHSAPSGGSEVDAVTSVGVLSPPAGAAEPALPGRRRSPGRALDCETQPFCVPSKPALAGLEPRHTAPPGGSEPHKVGSVGAMCLNCDNCLNPPAVWDATEAARKLLSCIYRVQQASGISFGAGHIMDILRGKPSEKMAQFSHDKLSTFGIGADLSEAQWRAVLRQLIAKNMVRVDTEAYSTLALLPDARQVLKGEVRLVLREQTSTAAGSGKGSRAKKPTKTSVRGLTESALNAGALERLAKLKAWRADVAREHNLPAFVIFHDSTLRAIAERAPQRLTDLQGIAGIGANKLEAYGAEVVRVCVDQIRPTHHLH